MFWELVVVKDEQGKLPPLYFGQNRISNFSVWWSRTNVTNPPFNFGLFRKSNSWDIADIEFLVVGGWVVVGGGPESFSSQTQLLLSCGWIGGLTKIRFYFLNALVKHSAIQFYAHNYMVKTKSIAQCPLPNPSC